MIRVTAMLALMGALAGFSTSLILPRRYVATATSAFRNTPSDPSELLRHAFARTMESESLVALIVRNASLNSRLDFTPMKDEIEMLRAGAAAHVTGADSFAVQFQDEDKFQATDIAKSLLTGVAANVTMLDQSQAGPKLNPIVRVDEAGVTTRMLSLTGLAAGLLLAGLLRLLRK